MGVAHHALAHRLAVIAQGRITQVLHQLVERFGSLRDVLQFVAQRAHKVREVLIRREESILHHRRYRHLVIHRAEIGAITLGILRILLRVIRRRGRQPQHNGVAKQLIGCRQHPAPMAHKVVAFIENHQTQAIITHVLERVQRGRVQQFHRAAFQRNHVAHFFSKETEAVSIVFRILGFQAFDPHLSLRRILGLTFLDEMIHPIENRHHIQRIVIARRQRNGLIGKRGQVPGIFRVRAHPVFTERSAIAGE